MYLLMLLATFMSAIYGYNLSARPDYDRDIVRKKAASVVYRFTFQHFTARWLAFYISSGVSPYSDRISFIMPGDLLYAKEGEDDVIIVKQQGGSGIEFDLGEGDNGLKLLVRGRALYPGDDMASKIVCVDKPMYEEDSKMCSMAGFGSDEDGYTGTCCGTSMDGGRYLVSFKRLDPRWINRMTGKPSGDFIHSMHQKDYSENLGIINWDGENWQFVGKLRFEPTYHEAMIEWEKEHNNSMYPAIYRQKNRWTLPNAIFDKDFFKVNNVNLCEQTGCLFKIQML